MTVLAEVRGLRIEIAGRALVTGVDLTARAGRVTALVGASGSGKTTTGRALLGEYPPGARVTGTVRLPGGPAAYVPQHPSSVLNPARRVRALPHDIARARFPRAVRREKVAEALESAQFPPALLARHPHRLSGGQQQRVVLAQALLLGARVVVADEPTTGQDPLTARRVAAGLAALARRGLAVVLLSHDLALVRELADDVLVMRDGEVIESGATGTVWSSPRHPWTRELLAPEPTRPAPRTPGPPVLWSTAPPLTVHAGGTLALVGRSGSGKTTLARRLAGLHTDRTGEVLLDGSPLPRSVRHRSRSQLAAVQYVFQDARASFDEHRPVVDQVARTAIRLRGLDRRPATAEAYATLARTGLPEALARRRPAALSGGELHRAALARALLARPRVLICDELTSGLDTVTRRAVLGLLTGLTRTPDAPALVLITHDADVAARADRIAVVDAGRIVEEGATPDVLAAPRHPFTRALVADLGRGVFRPPAATPPPPAAGRRG
ncbi:ABC transporter ATP-binding protein [Streptomyces sp. AV19]|uniref:ABC transporter ATP-binding protein n=1 Tax=Streptomyces sp. AV19 TaxID=2793068 RepID=UPI0018FE16B0|nr:ATP-binding cassette domain-containing protein [Streptomyces sp. AV19]MBH1937301.1 ABC transporter ATP-binding protein [Streptomyces sp. AV19]MDG4536779.1 ATP-binding cassette domain-containing protein [Streptomyces sp. AV19]